MCGSFDIISSDKVVMALTKANKTCSLTFGYGSGVDCC